MRFSNNFFYKTALHIAVESENFDVIKLLLSSPNINVNAISLNSTILN